MSILRKTKTVKLLLDLFDKENKALPVVDLVSFFSAEMNKTTVYRILHRLEEYGILHSFIDKDGLKRYAKGDQRNSSSSNKTIHPPFLCEDWANSLFAFKSFYTINT
jgi:Fe2+/Zn2+ uptake regulation proteins